jgi:hypothetical protein
MTNHPMNKQEFDRLLGSIREEAPDSGAIRQAGERVRTRLEEELGAAASAGILRTCADFRELKTAYRNHLLTDSRRMLVEDHLHSCVACRKAFAGNVIAIPERSKRTPKVLPWAIAAAAVLAVGASMPSLLERFFTPSGPRATVASVDGELYRVTNQGSVVLNPGAPIGEDDEIRTANGARAVVRLTDGSRVEMAERSDLTLSERWSGKTIHLARGSVMVEAAKQRRGRLEVATADCLVSVKGTIFEVSRGTKGSRVSVVEGEVKVDRDGASNLLHRGDQTATSASLAKTSVAEDVSWSGNSAKYAALLGELSGIQKRIEALPGPGLRYQSKLADLLPADTVIFAAIPNPGSTLTEAANIFEERAKESPALNEWWNQSRALQLRGIVNQVSAFSDDLGDEIVLAVPGGGSQDVIVLAEARLPELRKFLETRFPEPGSPVHWMMHGKIVALATQPASLARIASAVDSGTGGFPATPFGARIKQSYRNGAGWIFAADMEQILSGRVSHAQSAMQPAAYLKGVRYLMVERKPNLGRTENRASLSFSGESALGSWLAAPGPMGSLDFVSPEASFAGAVVVKNPAALLGQLTAMGAPHLDVDALKDIAGDLGGEVAIAMDGPLLPTPSWKIAVEVDNPSHLESSIEQWAKSANVSMTSQGVNGLTYRGLKAPNRMNLYGGDYKKFWLQGGYEIDYVFTDGYLLIAPSPALLTEAIANRAAGITLPRSNNFRAQLPLDGHANFSALLYYNLGSQLGPAVDQLKSGGLVSGEKLKTMEGLTANREPGLIYAYGEPDRIVVASRSGFFGLNLQTLLGLNSKGAGALPQLLPPAFSMSRNARN